jgi:hypothetical protein
MRVIAEIAEFMPLSKLQGKEYESHALPMLPCLLSDLTGWAPKHGSSGGLGIV